MSPGNLGDLGDLDRQTPKDTGLLKDAHEEHHPDEESPKASQLTTSSNPMAPATTTSTAPMRAVGVRGIFYAAKSISTATKTAAAKKLKPVPRRSSRFSP